MPARDEILQANADYAARFAAQGLAAAPSRRLAVVTCMDARLDPAGFLGLAPGDAHVVRNAGGLVTDDALRSLAVSHWLLGTEQALVIGHTDCGMLSFANDDLRGRVGPPADGMDFLPFGDLEESVRAAVRRIAESPLLPTSFAAAGFVYDVQTGALRAV